MRHLSVWMTVLLLGSVPLTAAALDYGPDSPLLAGNANAPRLPDAQGRAASMGDMPQPDVAAANADDGEDAAAAPATTHPGTAPPQHPGPAKRNSGSTASNRWRLPVVPAAPQPTTATWQSLLPGSIQ